MLCFKLSEQLLKYDPLTSSHAKVCYDTIYLHACFLEDYSLLHVVSSPDRPPPCYEPPLARGMTGLNRWRSLAPRHDY